MKPGYFESYARVLSKTARQTKARDNQDKPLAPTNIENQSGRPVKVIDEQSGAERMTDRKNGDG